ncbi:MAG: NlpC/P60 family protein [Flavipsychrobacter sp.]
MMNRLLGFSFTLIILSCTILIGCGSSQYTTSSSYKRKAPSSNTTIRYRSPRFMKNVEVGGNNSSKINMIVVESFEHGRRQQYITDILLLKYAQKMQVMPQEVTNYPLYRFIEDWYGVRYRYGGTDRSGIDCSAFTQRLYDKVYCTDIVRTCYQQYKMTDRVWDKSLLLEGDLVFFKTRGRRISHVGIYLANNYFVHASTSGGIMISNITEDYWQRRYAGAGKVAANMD